MMDSTKIMDLIERLDDEVDDLEEALEPLLKETLSETSSKLPLLDKAKLYVLVTYAIESLLFSYLRLHGVDARKHPVFIELTRVKQYFQKIKTAEAPPVERNLALDKGAASRFIKAGLAGNEKYDLQRAEREAKERAKAHIRFEELSKEINKKRKAIEEVESEKPKADTSDSSDSDSDSDSDSSSAAEPVKEKTPPPPVAAKKKRKLNKSESAQTSGNSTPSSSESQQQQKKIKEVLSVGMEKEVAEKKKPTKSPKGKKRKGKKTDTR